VELDYQGVRLVIDCGEPITPLDEHHAADGQHPLPNLKSLTEPDRSLLGVLLSHGHKDHWGQLDRTRANIPIYMGEKTQAMQAVSARWGPKPKPDESQQPSWTTRLGGYLEDRRTFSVGPFDVTPYLVCHSGFDAYAFLVQAGGKQLFYSGDFRGHGRKAALFEALVARPPRNIDALMMEGSSLSRLASPDNRFETETQTEARLVEAAKTTQGLMIVAASAQNIDRGVSIYRAAKRTGRTLVIDLYAAQILETCKANSIPQSDWPNMALWIPASQRRTIKANAWFDSLERHSQNRVYLDKDIRAAPEKYILLGRPFMLEELSKAEVLAGARLVWSQWAGYLDAPHFAQDLKDKAGAFGLTFEVIHTSGHADLADLQKFAGALNPRQLVPIHTFEPARYSQLFENVVQRSDGQWWEV
jgi:ribonuclease J